ncbi:non-ribosomal peptide synthetase [Streptomyces sp. CB03238]|uniref:non-ribosomal peptide synthetase n=1 Tax=Streptomyces sp. CB03238 TaxID=1907777 RepID=UPI000A0F6318|nr:non-ribosomal peptide synthetase [Streptomyces sp. CB03238]ORT60867.1 hypothetical protein BKD26_06605 [Streptomyces sp. CB03238]
MSIERRVLNPYPLERAPRPDGHPLSAGQERLWWQRQSDDGARYHVTGGWHWGTEVDPDALTRALDALVRRHEILRTAFVLGGDGTVTARLRDGVRVPVRWAGKDWAEAVEDAARRPFDLAGPPLARAVVARLDDGYGLFVAQHHIVSDRWSMDVFGRDLYELYELYAAECQGRSPRLPVPKLQFGDYALWQRRLQASEALRPVTERWLRRLDGCERLELVTDHPRPAADADDDAGREVVMTLSSDDTDAVSALAWRSRASQAVVVTAALAATLKAFTGQHDVVIGAMLSDRPSPELHDVMGFFVNTVVLRVDLSGERLTFRQIIRRTRDAWMFADAHQDVPFERLVAALGAGAGAGRHPLFDITVNHAGGRPGAEEGGGTPPAWEPQLPTTARFDLSLHTRVVDGRLRAGFLYRPALFHHATVTALAERCVRLLEQGARAPDVPLADLDLLDRAERDRLWRRNDPADCPGATVVELVRNQVRLRPTATAVTGAREVLSYAGLERRAARLAHRLVAYGAGPERVVAVCLERTTDTPVVLLAVALTGAAYLPLDPGLPAERLRFLLDDAGAVLIVVHPALRARLPGTDVPLLVYDGDPAATTETAPDAPAGDDVPRAFPAPDPDSAAYLISTSGSTGTPKCVTITHRALGRLVSGAPRYLDVGPGTTFLQTGPLSFDVAVLEWAPLAHGGRVAVVDTGALLEELGPALRAHRVTTLKLVSPQLDLVVERGPAALAGLRELVVGGDVVNPRSFEAVRRALPGCRVLASYGPTESTVLATVSTGPVRAGRVPLGHAVPYTRVYILDEDLRPVPVGMRGEIHLAGDGLARGYHRRPGTTAAAFLPDPFGPPGSRMYRTGDLGRYLADGTIDFLGRADRQVKIRGYRIETSEIEHALVREPAVASAVVVAADLDTGPALVAYVVPAASQPFDPGELRRCLAARLPAYMLPAHIVQLSRLPLTVRNKVDRSALPPPRPVRPSSVSSVSSVPVARAGAANALEERVCEAWSTVLGHPLSGTDDFFTCGGHSLLVPRATAAVRNLLGREVPLRLMLRHRTPAAYASALLEEGARGLDGAPGLDGTSRLDGTPGLDGTADAPYRLERSTWCAKGLDGERRVDFYASGAGQGGDVPRWGLVVLDGGEFVDVVRLPAILQGLVGRSAVPTVAAVFVSPGSWRGRREELLADGYADLLADEVVPLLEAWTPAVRPGPVFCLGASLGGVAAVRAALRRPDRFAGAIALSSPLSDHRLEPVDGVPAAVSSRLYLHAGRAEADLVLADGTDLPTGTARTGERLRRAGHAVTCAYGPGGHTYAAWQNALPEAVTWLAAGEPTRS